jgi:DNA mismatch repair ATPase MutS
MSHVDAAILDLVAHLRPEPFLALDEFCARWESFADERLTAFDREVQFYLAYLRYVDGLRAQGLPFSLPVMSDESKKTVCRDAFDPALADVLAKKKQVPVLNDLALSGVERILVITGPNQGGKTTYARLFGQLAYLAGLGLPVPAREASLFLCDRVFTHFERQEGAGTGRGKLQDELLRLRGVLATATPKSVLILNEMFSSTSVEDARELSRWIMERLSRLDLLCASTTFLDELSVLNEKTVSVVAGIDADDPARRTFRLERRPADGLAYATALAEKHRLTYARLKERLKR